MRCLDAITQKEKLLKDAADYIWDHPELSFQEHQCSAYLCNILKKEEFDVRTGLAGIPTAFSARYGKGRPVIGILGEFDALPNLAQEAGITCKQGDEHGNGHGCGHNLLAGSSLGAVLGIQAYLKEHPGAGTVIYFGCPAEECGSAKAFMARDGVFDELDAALGMHPDTVTGVRARTSLANCEYLFRFDGIASHASILPYLGRSALDAVELMDVGANYLREHIIESARVHYAITDSGGYSPNVVQAHAEVLYLIRAPKNEQVQDIMQRICKIAKGAALMTETKVTPVFVKACSNTVLNDTLQRVIYRSMKQIGSPVPTAEEVRFAKKMTIQGLSDIPAADPKHPLHYELEPYNGTEEIGSGSTDVGDVSWVCPTAQIKAGMYAFGTPNHSWQQTAQGKSTWAKRVMLYVAKSLCLSAVKLYQKPELLEKAKSEHIRRIGAKGYECPIPSGVKPNEEIVPYHS